MLTTGSDSMDLHGNHEEIKIRIDLTFENFDSWGGAYYHMGHKSTDFIQE
jgi:hypothetical protein